MDVIKSYKELCEELQIWKLRVETYKAQIEAIKKMAKFDGPTDITGIDYTVPKVQNTKQMSLEDALRQIRKIESHLQIHQEAIQRMEKAKEEIEKRIEQLDGLDKKVVYMRDIEGKSLKEIAQELNYGYDWIRKISARNPKYTTKNTHIHIK